MIETVRKTYHEPENFQISTTHFHLSDTSLILEKVRQTNFIKINQSLGDLLSSYYEHEK